MKFKIYLLLVIQFFVLQSFEDQGFSIIKQESDLSEEIINSLNEYRRVFLMAGSRNKQCEMHLQDCANLLKTPSTDMQENKRRVLESILYIKRPHVQVHKNKLQWHQPNNLRFADYLNIQIDLNPHPFWRPRRLDRDVRVFCDIGYQCFPFDYVCSPKIPSDELILDCMKYMQVATDERLQSFKAMKKRSQEEAIRKGVLTQENQFVVFVPKEN